VFKLLKVPDQRMLLLVLLLLFWFSPRVNAQWPTSPDSAVYIGPGGHPMMAISDGEGGLYVVWGTYNVVAQHVTRHGVREWPFVELSGTRDVQELAGDVALSSDGGLLVSYIDITFTTPPEAGYRYVRVQKLDTAGTKLWGDHGVQVSLDLSTQYDNVLMGSVLAGDGNGGVFVNWYDQRHSPWNTADDVYLQHLTAAGTPSWVEGGLRMSPSGGIEHVYLGTLPGNTVLVGQWNNGHFQRMTPAGARLWAEEGRQFPPGTAWQWEVTDSIGSTFGEVLPGHFSKVNLQAEPQWGDSGRQVLSGSYLYALSDVIPDQQGGVLLNLGVDDNGYQGCTQWVNKRGVPVFTSEPLRYTKGHSIDERSYYGTSHIIQSDSGTFIGTWMTKDTVAETYQFYAQRYDTTGTPLWGDEPVLLYGPGESYAGHHPIALSDGQDGMILVFEMDWNIYAQQINKYGQLGQVITEIQPEAPPLVIQRFHLAPPFPNPFNAKLNIPFSLDNATVVTLNIFSLQGKLVWSSTRRYRSPGDYSIQWHGQNNEQIRVSSGLYLIQMITSQGEYQYRKACMIK